MRTRARERERDETGDDTPSTRRPVETTANTRRRDAATRAFGDFDDVRDDRTRDATAETLVDMKLTTRVVGEQDRVDDEDDDDGTRYCSSCKQYLSAERFPGAHRKTCATCLRWHKLYQRRKRKKRKK